MNKIKNLILSAQIQHYRKVVQFIFLFVTLWIGLEFIIFVNQLDQGQLPTQIRPPGVEAFLPISALMSLKYWILTGVFNTIHPSGLIILLVIIATAVLLKKGFCSWICPIGLLSEYLEKIHILIFDKPRKLPKWLDYPLRSLKYILLLFFLYAVIVQMDVLQLQKFIYSPYNKVADIKMLQFFSDMSSTTFRVLAALLLLSILIRYFWCRYLCPYGAFLGSLSWSSPFKIRRNTKTCIDCEKCTKICPSNIQVHRTKNVFSDECHACFKCVDSCPVEKTLYLSTRSHKYKLKGFLYAVIIVLLFLLSSTIASMTGFWQNSITPQEYQHYYQNIDKYDHARGPAE